MTLRPSVFFVSFFVLLKCWASAEAVELKPSVCENVLKNIAMLRSKSQMDLDGKIEPLLSRIKRKGIVGFHGTGMFRLLNERALTLGAFDTLQTEADNYVDLDGSEFDIPSAHGFPIWSAHPEVLQREGFKLSFHEKDFSGFSANSRWPTFEQSLQFAQGYAQSKRTAFSILGEVIKPEREGVILGIHRDMYQDFRSEIYSAPDLDGYQSHNFYYPNFSMQAGQTLSFNSYFPSLIFADRESRNEFNRKLDWIEARAQSGLMSSSSMISPRAPKIQIEDAYNLFVSKPGQFMRSVQEPGSEVQNLVIKMNEDWRAKFNEAHPETWEYFLELEAQGFAASVP